MSSLVLYLPNHKCPIIKAILKNFAISTKNHGCWSLFLIKLYWKETLQHKYFPVNIAKCLKKPILKNILERLLLCIPLNLLSCWRHYLRALGFVLMIKTILESSRKTFRYQTWTCWEFEFYFWFSLKETKPVTTN